MFLRGILKEYAFSLSIIARLIDVSAVLVGAILAYWWRYDSIDISTNYRVAILLGTILTPIIFGSFGIYYS